MILLAKILAVLFVLIGIVYVLLPSMMDKMVQIMKMGKNAYIFAIIRAVFGVVFLFAAAGSRIPWLVTTMVLLLCHLVC
jgi:hypothetical protein